MARDRSRRSPGADDSWRCAIVGGLVALPVTAVSYWQTGSEIGLWPVVFGGLLAGYLYEGPSAVRSRVGSRAGLVGALPALWLLVDLLCFVRVELGGAAMSRLRQSAVAVAGVAGVLAIAVIAGMIGARIGGWLRGKIERFRPPAVAR